MAFSAVAFRGNAVETVSDNAISVSPTAALTAGKLVICSVAIKNIATIDGASNTVTSVADSKNNTWVKVDERTETAGAGNDGSTSAVFYSIIVNQIEITDSITAALSGSIGDKIIGLTEAVFEHNTNTIKIEQVAVGQNAITATLSGMTSREYLLVGSYAGEGSDNTKTADADYTERLDARSRNNAAAITIHVQTRIATLTDDTCTSTAWTATERIAVLVAFFEEVLPPVAAWREHTPMRTARGLGSPGFVAGSALCLLAAIAPELQPFVQADWPVPSPHARQILTTTTRPQQDATTPIIPAGWEVPTALRRSPSFDPPNLLASTFGVAPAPFLQTDWPSPQRLPPLVQLRVHVDTLTIQLQGQDQFFGAPGQGPVYDWPVPLRPGRADQLTWTQNLLQSTLQPAEEVLPFRQQGWSVPAPRAGQLLISSSTRPSDVAAAVASPFSLTDWPTPRGLVSAIDLRTWLQSRKTYYEDIQPFNAGDWPVPLRREDGIGRRIWTLSLQQSTLAPADANPLAQTDWPVPLLARGRVAIEGPPNLLVGTLAVAPATPFTQTDWPTPSPVRVGVITDRTHLQTRPIFAVDESPFNQYDWPVPPPRQAALAITVSTRPSDTAVAGDPFTQTAWPIPAPRPPRPQTWIDTRPFYYEDIQPFSQSDWATPHSRDYSIGARIWTQNLLQSTLTPAVVVSPFSQTEWPIPSRVPAATLLRAWSEVRKFYYQDEQPFSQLDWPVPLRARIVPITSRWFAFYYVFDETAPFLGAIQPLPQPTPAALGLRTWIQNLLASTLAPPPPPMPFVQSEWPLPRTAGASIALRTHIEIRKFYHQDVQPFSLSEWPVPLGRDPLVSRRTWMLSLQQTTLAPAPEAAPFTQTDWPAPARPVHPVALRTWLEPRKSYYVDLSPLNQYDWPTPRVPGRACELLTWIHNLAESTLSPQPTPFAQAEWVIPQGRPHPVVLRTWVKARELGIVEPLPFAQADWPNPGGRPEPRTNRTWTEAPSLALVINAGRADIIELYGSTSAVELYGVASGVELEGSESVIFLWGRYDG